MASEKSANEAEKPAVENKAKSRPKQQSCSRCNQDYFPARVIERMQKKFPDNAEVLAMCPSCRRQKTAEELASA